MSTATEQLTKVQDQILETLASIHKPIVDAVKSLADRAESVVPDVPAVPGTESLPTVDEIVINQFGFAEKLLEQQKEFTSALIEAVKPVADKVVTPAAPAKSKTKATPKAA
jgi:hypothetical protein